VSRICSSCDACGPAARGRPAVQTTRVFLACVMILAAVVVCFLIRSVRKALALVAVVGCALQSSILNLKVIMKCQGMRALLSLALLLVSAGVASSFTPCFNGECAGYANTVSCYNGNTLCCYGSSGTYDPVTCIGTCDVLQCCSERSPGPCGGGGGGDDDNGGGGGGSCDLGCNLPASIGGCSCKGPFQTCKKSGGVCALGVCSGKCEQNGT
jgi:hypothetical protein